MCIMMNVPSEDYNRIGCLDNRKKRQKRDLDRIKNGFGLFIVIPA